MKKATVLRMLLTIMMIAGLVMPAVAAAGTVEAAKAPSTVSTRGKFSYTAPGEWPDDGDIYRWDHSWNVSGGTDRKPLRGSFVLKQFVLQDDWTAVTPTLLNTYSWPVTQVTRVDEDTIDFYAANSWGWGNWEPYYYANGWWRIEGGSRSSDLWFGCSVCGSYHPMSDAVTGFVAPH